MGRCLQSAQSAHMLRGGMWQGAPRQLSAVAGPGRPGGVCTTGIARASASGQLPQQVRHMASYMQAA